VPAAPDLIKLVFLSGKAPLNEAVLNDFAERMPELPLYVVAEFKPDRGVWIPWHVKRGFRRNKEAIEAALNGKRIQCAAIVLASRHWAGAHAHGRRSVGAGQADCL
jgi:hypothetical protein